MILDSVPSSSSSSVPRTAWEDSEVKSQAWEHIAHGNVELVLRSIAEEPTSLDASAARARWGARAPPRTATRVSHDRPDVRGRERA